MSDIMKDAAEHAESRVEMDRQELKEMSDELTKLEDKMKRLMDERQEIRAREDAMWGRVV